MYHFLQLLLFCLPPIDLLIHKKVGTLKRKNNYVDNNMAEYRQHHEDF